MFREEVTAFLTYPAALSRSVRQSTLYLRYGKVFHRSLNNKKLFQNNIIEFISILVTRPSHLFISNKKEFNHFFKSRSSDFRRAHSCERSELRAMRMLCERSEQIFFIIIGLECRGIHSSSAVRSPDFRSPIQTQRFSLLRTNHSEFLILHKEGFSLLC